MNLFEPRSLPRGALPTEQIAANDDLAPSRTLAGRTTDALLGVAGWDPFEIWRTRVRDARRDATRPRPGGV